MGCNKSTTRLVGSNGAYTKRNEKTMGHKMCWIGSIDQWQIERTHGIHLWPDITTRKLDSDGSYDQRLIPLSTKLRILLRFRRDG